MEGLLYEALPVIAVSAKDYGAAATIISEIIDNECTEMYEDGENQLGRDRVWRIVNKYYTADVKLRPVVDDEGAEAEAGSAEAHVVYLTEEEAAAAAADIVRRRCAGAPLADTRLVVVAGAARAGDELRAAAGRARAELVPLAAAAAAAEDEDEWGVARVRAALHAHAWRGRRCARPPAGDVERAESFAAALGALPAAGRLARDDAGAGRELRLQRAEALVAAFCHALGDDLDAC